jgi:hypothetical protein
LHLHIRFVFFSGKAIDPTFICSKLEVSRNSSELRVSPWYGILENIPFIISDERKSGKKNLSSGAKVAFSNELTSAPARAVF